MSSIRTAKQICKLQGIKLHLEVMVLCPSCRKKTLKLDLTDDDAEYIRCGKSYNSVEEVEKIEEADYIENHKETDIEMRTNRGDI